MLAAPNAPLRHGAGEYAHMRAKMDTAHEQARALLPTGTQARAHLEDLLGDADSD